MNSTPSPDMPALSECPFCGSTDVHIEHDDPVMLKYIYVACHECGGQSKHSAHVERVVAAWNRRSRLPAGDMEALGRAVLWLETNCTAENWTPAHKASLARLLESLAREERERCAGIVAEQQVTANLGVYWVHEPAKIAAAIRKARP